MRRILTVAEPDVMVQLVRLIVLYEDLKLEVAGFHVPPDKEFDEVSKHYRSMYFIRRAFATLWEIGPRISPEQSPRADGVGRPPLTDRGHAAVPGSMPSRSFTAHRSFCLHPGYRSVVWTETWPRRNWICSSSPPAR